MAFAFADSEIILMLLIRIGVILADSFRHSFEVGVYALHLAGAPVDFDAALGFFLAVCDY